MAITKKPNASSTSPALAHFIEAAPDGSQTARVDDEESVQITLRLSRAQLARIGTMAKRQGVPRASYIKRSVFVQLEADEQEK